jgi:hypothetical protein
VGLPDFEFSVTKKMGILYDPDPVDTVHDRQAIILPPASGWVDKQIVPVDVHPSMISGGI